MTGYDAGLRNHRVTIVRRAEGATGEFGSRSAGEKYQTLGTFWVAKDFNRGVKSMREGAMDAYDTVMFRMLWYKGVDRQCLINSDGVWYQIQSFNTDRQRNTIQITAVERANQTIQIINP